MFDASDDDDLLSEEEALPQGDESPPPPPTEKMSASAVLDNASAFHVPEPAGSLKTTNSRRRTIRAKVVDTGDEYEAESVRLQRAARKAARAVDRKRREETCALPAYDRPSMHGKKIVLSVGPSSLPEGMRVTYTRIPPKRPRL